MANRERFIKASAGEKAIKLMLCSLGYAEKKVGFIFADETNNSILPVRPQPTLPTKENANTKVFAFFRSSCA